MSVLLRACVTCGDEYYGDSWGTNLDENGNFSRVITDRCICFYCESGTKDRQWKPEWIEKEK
jgi:hypothetical protein